MNTMELASIIEQYRPLEALSSLPIAILNSNGETRALWFNFYLDQNENELIISITSIFTMDHNKKIEETRVKIQLKETITEYDEPLLSRQEYLSTLESQFTCYNSDKMDKLLAQAELQPLLIAYKTVKERV